MKYRRIAVVMAGGAGERFWPLSRRLFPKQLLKLAHPDKSLLAQTVDRVEPLVGLENVLIATAPHLIQPIQEAMPELSERQVQAEPHKRNTAGCLVWTAAQILAQDPKARNNASMAVLTADHRVSPDDGFRRTVQAALDLAEETGGLVTIGIRPDRPETGFGYIEMSAEALPQRHGVTLRPVAAFKEKPDATTAEEFVKSGRFLWNSGTFFWRIDSFLDELAFAAPDLAEAVPVLADLIRAGKTEEAESRFAELRNISIDYALMEKARKVFVAEADFNWDDVGSWDALDRSLPQDAAGNVSSGPSLLVETQNSIVMNDCPEVMTCLLGVENLTVVVTKDAVLVIPKDRAQDVKKIVEELKAQDSERL